MSDPIGARVAAIEVRLARLETLLDAAPHRGSPMPCRVITATVAAAHGVTLEELTGEGRRDATVRHLAMLLCRRLTGASYQQIGRAFRRDHSSVIYGLRSAEARVHAEPAFAADLARLEARCRLALTAPEPLAQGASTCA